MAPTLYDKKPKPGDLIAISRGLYQHWVLYVGDGYVVHLGPACASSVMSVPTVSRAMSSPTVSCVMSVPSVSNVMSVTTEKAVVKKEKLSDVVGTDKWEINNSLDKKYKPRPVNVIVKEALALVGEELSYCLFRGNCEHFVTKLRYGKAVSIQVWKAGVLAMAMVAFGLVGLGIVALFGRSQKENKNTQ